MREKEVEALFGVSYYPALIFWLAHSVIFRYALQLLTPASITSILNGRSEITVEDVSEMTELFLDAKTSAEMIGTFEGGN